MNNIGQLHLTSSDRLPFETAIEIIETLTGDGIYRDSLLEQAKQQAGEQIGWWVEHTIMLLRSNGYVKRVNVSEGVVYYTPTSIWGQRNMLLAELRHPKKKPRTNRNLKRFNAKQERFLARSQ